MSLRQCIGCGILITKGSRCQACSPRNGSTRSWRKTRAQLLKGDPRCYLCGAPATQVDHIIPVIHGGTDHPDNLEPICGPCNRSKGST